MLARALWVRKTPLTTGVDDLYTWLTFCLSFCLILDSDWSKRVCKSSFDHSVGCKAYMLMYAF